MKSLILCLGLVFALPAFAQDYSVAATLERIETDTNSKCELTNVGASLCVVYVCWRKQKYVCMGNEGVKRIGLKIKTLHEPVITGEPGPAYDEKVTKIYTYN